LADRYYRFSGGGGIPDGIKYLLIWNGIVYLLQKILAHSGFFLEPLFGMVPAYFWQGYAWQCVTYMFLHGGIFHILINMFILWMFGSDLERILGTRRFIACYFFSGIGAGLLNAVVTPHAPIPTVGASGAIYGVLVGYALYFPERRVLLYFLIPIPARVFVIFLGVIALVNSLGQPGGNISHVTHLGGFVFGWLYLRGFGPGDLLRRLRRRRQGMRVIDFTRERDRWG
jgi:membrane associated rhomboid family serine protease